MSVEERGQDQVQVKAAVGAEGRTAVDIAAAANAAIEIALLAVEFLPDGTVAAKVARGVRKFAPAAKVVAQKLSDAAPAMVQIAEKAQDKMPAVAAVGAEKVGGVVKMSPIRLAKRAGRQGIGLEMHSRSGCAKRCLRLLERLCWMELAIS